ncbi:MAG TPA: ClpXP protease specificity-enhancing factor SspB [Polyangiaceae bacterium]|nr:ClpXP protease specificity-enhancing factor SspB [Polyangiaceae bacterium]
MTRLPPKKDVALALLEQATVLIHLDPRGEQVQVPPWFKRQPQLVLQIGLNMPKPIPDLNVDDQGISCTLSFSNSPHYCYLPWGSVYALIGASGRGMVWPDDVPKEVAGQYVVTAPKEEPKPRTALKAVEAEPSPDEQAAKADAKKKKRARKAKAAKETEKAARATRSPKPKAEPTPEKAFAKERPARPAPVLAPAVAAAPGTPARRASGSPGGSGAAGSKKKRELPPYLRVVK